MEAFQRTSSPCSRHRDLNTDSFLLHADVTHSMLASGAHPSSDVTVPVTKDTRVAEVSTSHVDPGLTNVVFLPPQQTILE